MTRLRRASSCDRVHDHDRGSASPLILAVFVLASLVVVAVGRVASSLIDASRAQVAAEAMAHAAALSADLEAIAHAHGVSSYELARDEHLVTVRVVRRGHESSASASDHRRTLEPGQ